MPKTIGSTSSGKPVFAAFQFHRDFADWTIDDHHDAAELHRAAVRTDIKTNQTMHKTSAELHEDEARRIQRLVEQLGLGGRSGSKTLRRQHATKKYDPVVHTRGVRAREIVRLAAEQIKDPSARYWLLADERGTFEKAARKYLEETADKARALGMSNEKVNEEIAVMLALSAAEAFLKRARK